MTDVNQVVSDETARLLGMHRSLDPAVESRLDALYAERRRLDNLRGKPDLGEDERRAADAAYASVARGFEDLVPIEAAFTWEQLGEIGRAHALSRTAGIDDEARGEYLAAAMDYETAADDATADEEARDREDLARVSGLATDALLAACGNDTAHLNPRWRRFIARHARDAGRQDEARRIKGTDAH